MIIKKMKRYRVGVDLTSPVAQYQHGMAYQLISFLDATTTNNPDIEVILFCTEESATIYAKCESDLVRIMQDSPSLSEQEACCPDVLFHPFNEIFNTVSGVPNVVTLHDLIPFKLRQLYPQLDTTKFLRSINIADHVITISNASRIDAINYLGIKPDKITACTSSTDLMIDSFRKNDNKPILGLSHGSYIVYPATNRPHKNHAHLLAAFDKAESEFVLVLSTGEKHAKNRLDELQKLIDQCQKSASIINAKNLSYDEYCRLLLNSSGLIFPSLAEGFGLPVLETMIAGRNIACSFNSSLIEVAGNRAIFFDPYQEDDIARAIEMLWLNRDCNPSATDSDTWLSRFTPQQQAFDYGNIFRKVIQRVPRQNKKTRVCRSIIGSAHTLHQSIFGQQYTANLYALAADLTPCKALADSINAVLSLRKWQNCSSSSIAADTTSPTITVLMDVTRLFCGNPHSGITKYGHSILNELANVKEILLLPFYNPKSRGYKGKQDMLHVDYSLNERNITVLHCDTAMQIASAQTMPVIYFSTYHPLPAERNPLWYYCISIFDIIHLTDKTNYPDGATRKYITVDIVKSIQQSDLIMAISRFSLDEIVNYLGFEPLGSIIYLAPATQEPPVLDAERNIDILIPFQNDPRKHFDRMIRCAASVIKAMSDKRRLRIVVFGKPNMKDNSLLLELMHEFPGSVDCVITPSDKELAMLYCRSKCLLYLSESEGFGLPPLEAMSFGCPSVLLNNTSLKEIFQGWRFKQQEFCPDSSIVKTVIDILSSDSSMLAQLSVEFSSHFSFERTLCMHLAGFVKLINTGKL